MYNKNPINTLGSKGIKILSSVFHVDMKTPLDRFQATAMIETSAVEFHTNERWTFVNYCVVLGENETEEMFGGIYFITDIIGVSHNVIAVTMELDVLNTFATQIREQTAVVARSASTYNTDIVDPNFITTGGTETSYIKATQQNIPDVVVSMRTL